MFTPLKNRREPLTWGGNTANSWGYGEFKSLYQIYGIEEAALNMNFDASVASSVSTSGANLITEFRSTRGYPKLVADISFAPTYSAGLQNGLGGVVFPGGKYLNFFEDYRPRYHTAFFVMEFSSGPSYSTFAGSRYALGSIESPPTAPSPMTTEDYGSDADSTSGSYHGNISGVAGSLMLDNGSNCSPETRLGSAWVNGASISPTAITKTAGAKIYAFRPTASLRANLTKIGADNALSGSRAMVGKIFEIVIFNRALTNAEVDRVGSLLAYKWGLTWV